MQLIFLVTLWTDIILTHLINVKQKETNDEKTDS